MLGDLQVLLARAELVDQSAKQTATAITEATAAYQAQVDDMVAKLRVETASIVLKTTEHAAQSLVGQQQATLQKAATLALQQALTDTVLKRTRRDWIMTASVSALTGSIFTLGLMGAHAWLFGS
ncbi:hypothetical protein EIP75_21745 [Aquabacterium soli]|uniref:Uncharacterized protein n=1 Tax=Aquabacterium soli TaxID=2493092 RepID=A0A426V2X4_9BURK|nr:hypothetical protein [Aquabacterium soli]RRS01201.1 hypothetical protein EIP75_21745 [Aquabacterium soli]